MVAHWAIRRREHTPPVFVSGCASLMAVIFVGSAWIPSALQI